jgi:hypothetical protein
MSRVSFSIVVIFSSRFARWRVTPCAFFESSQNPGASVDSSRRSISFFSFGTSKMPP